MFGFMKKNVGKTLLVLSVGVLFSCFDSKKSDTIVIGNYGSMTGSEATFGLSTRDGILLAMEQLNAQGGINGKKVELKVYDNQGKPEEARLSVEKLINVDNVVAILGEVASTRSLAAAPVAQQYKVPMISPSSTNPEVTKKGDYIFRVCFIDPFQGSVMAKFAFNSLKLKKAVILRDSKSDYSVGLADYFIKTFTTELTGSIVADEKYQSGDVDFKAQLTSIKGKDFDFIFLPGYYTEVGLLARQARELGITKPILGGDGWDSPTLFEVGGDALNNTYISNHFSPDDPRPEVVAYVKTYKERFGVVPDGLSSAGYDAANVLFAAMKKAPSLKGEDLRNAIADTKNFPGVTGLLSLNENRDAVKSAVILKIENGKFNYLETVNP